MVGEKVELKWITDWKNSAVRRALKNVWLESYEDPETYIDFFFENVHGKVQVLAGFDNGKLISGVYLFACQVVWETSQGLGKRQTAKAYYVYAGGVLRSYRGEGIYSDMYQAIRKKAKQEQAKIFLYALPSFRHFYEKRGLACYYESWEYALKWNNARQEEGAALTKKETLTAEVYEAMRDRRFATGSFVRWDKETLCYCLQEKQYCGGICDLLTIDGQPFALIGEIREEVLYVEETTMTLEQLVQYQNEIFALYHISFLKVRLPAQGEAVKQTGTRAGNDNRLIADNEAKETVWQCVHTGMGDIPAGSLWLSLTLL